MPLAPVTHQSWLFSPPLEPPLHARLENGRFDALRPRPLPRPAPCATGQVIPADDPSNPTDRDVHFANGLHQAVDLAAPGAASTRPTAGGWSRSRCSRVAGRPTSGSTITPAGWAS